MKRTTRAPDVRRRRSTCGGPRRRKATARHLRRVAPGRRSASYAPESMRSADANFPRFGYPGQRRAIALAWPVLGRSRLPRRPAYGQQRPPSPPVAALSIRRTPAREPDASRSRSQLDGALRVALQQQPQILRGASADRRSPRPRPKQRALAAPAAGDRRARSTRGARRGDVRRSRARGRHDDHATSGSMAGNSSGSTGNPSTIRSSISGSYDYFTFGADRDAAHLRLRSDVRQKYDAAKQTADVAARRRSGRHELDVLLERAAGVLRRAREQGARRRRAGDARRPAQAPGAGAGLRARWARSREIALAQQKAAVANAQVQLITAQNNYDTSKAQLNQAAGMPGGTDYDVSDEDVSPPIDGRRPAARDAGAPRRSRPAPRSRRSRSSASRSEADARRSAKGGYGPSLSRDSAGVSESARPSSAARPQLERRG